MIQITNGKLTLTVPNAAFHDMYEPAGFRPVKARRRVKTSGDSLPNFEDRTPEEENLDEETEDTDEDLDLSEIPLSEMGFEQLCEYADQLNIDHEGVRSKKELRALIRAEL